MWSRDGAHELAPASYDFRTNPPFEAGSETCAWALYWRQAHGREKGHPTMGETMAAIVALDAPPRTKPSNYPEPFASRMAGRLKRPLGDLFGLKNFGVNLTHLRAGAVSALHHRHSRQDEFIYVLEGEPILVTEAGETKLSPGMVAGFPAGGTAHHLENRTEQDCVLLEIGDRTQGDEVTYPADDIRAAMGKDGKWQFVHKDSRPY